MKKTLIFILTFNFYLLSAQTYKWKEYFTHNQAHSICQSEKKIYAANQTNIYIIDKENFELEIINKVSGELNDIDISEIYYSSTYKKLIIAYNNGNLDILDNNNSIVNIPFIKQKTIIGAKNITDCIEFEGRVIISTGFGLVELDIEKYEIVDTYYIGSGSSSIFVNSIDYYNDTIYAATSNGIKKASIQNSLKKDISWINETYESVEYSNILKFNDYLFASKKIDGWQNDSLYVKENYNWKKIDSLSNEIEIYSINQAKEQVVIGTSKGVYFFDENLNLRNKVTTIDGYSSLHTSDLIIDQNNKVWSADYTKGIVEHYNNTYGERISPDGPYSNSVFRIRKNNGRLWFSTASRFEYDFTNKGYYTYNKGEWTNVNTSTHWELNNVYDLHDFVFFNDNSDNVLIASYLNGLVRANPYEPLDYYNETNSPLKEVQWGGAVSISALNKDENDNIFVIGNNTSDSPLVVFLKDGTWVEIPKRTGLMNTVYGDMLYTAEKEFWVTKPDGGGILVFSSNDNVEDVNNYSFRILNKQVNNGSLPSNQTQCIAQDNNNIIYVGTDNGLAIFNNPEDVLLNEPINSNEIIIEQDGFVEAVLNGEYITDIEIDPANRKWIATKNSGIFLFSSDLTEQVYHFTTENSPLITDQINDLFLDDETGELYIATVDGLMVYSSDASRAVENHSSAFAYPNPVSNEYEGYITIKNLAEESNVRITDIEGNLIYTTTSKGGMATWNGKTLDGIKVKSGVYLALCSGFEGNNHTVVKIVLID